MATDIRTPYPCVFLMAYYTLMRILYYLNKEIYINEHIYF